MQRLNAGRSRLATLGTFVLVLTLGSISGGTCSDHEDEAAVETAVSSTNEIVKYRRKYTISTPEPLLCFPGFQDKLVELENTTLLQDIYNFKIIKPHDFARVLDLSFFSPAILISCKILYVLLRYAESDWIPNYTQDLVDAKIDAAIARSEIAHLRAKLESINNRLSTANDDRYPQEVKIAELVVAVDKSEEILTIFRDKDFIFFRNPEATMPFLVLYSGPSKILLQVASVLIPSKQSSYEEQLEKLNQTVEEYKQRAVTTRVERIITDKVKDYPEISQFAKDMWNHHVLPYDYSIKLLDPRGGWGSCHHVRTNVTHNGTEAELIMDEFLDDYKNVLVKKYDQFFTHPSNAFKTQQCQTTCGTGAAASSSYPRFYFLVTVSILYFLTH